MKSKAPQVVPLAEDDDAILARVGWVKLAVAVALRPPNTAPSHQSPESGP